MAPLDLVELDSISIQVIIDNELDPISPCPNPAVEQGGGLRHIAYRDPPRADGTREIRMEEICCSAHGLSLLITGIKGNERRSILFDAGPEGRAFELNATRLRLKDEMAKVERIVLSHWHRDHSGGIEKAVQMIGGEGVKVDLHPARPELRGVHVPGMEVVTLQQDPTFEEIEKAGGQVVKGDEAHTVLGGVFGVSGEIPRQTGYEKGLKFGVQLRNGKWDEDTMLRDERLLMCKVKEKGIIVFTGCSHAGVVNASRHAVQLGAGAPLYAVMGGFHLADAEPAHIQNTVADLKALDAQVLLTGHCTGWRAKFEIERQMPGRLVPSFVGSNFVL